MTTTTTRIEQLEDEARREGEAVLKLDDGNLHVRFDTELRPGLRYVWMAHEMGMRPLAAVANAYHESGTPFLAYNADEPATPPTGLMGCELSRDDAEQLLRGEEPMALAEARERADGFTVRAREIRDELRAIAPGPSTQREIERVVEDQPLRAKRKVLR